jgi:peptide/nickel transport system ATP-binding protein
VSTPVLSVRDLRVAFGSRRGTSPVVTGLDLDVAAGETLAVVGESGSGKSVSMLAVVGLLPASATVTGSVRLRGEEVLGAGPERLRQLRGREVGMVFQDPMTSLNPVLTIGRQLTEGLEARLGLDRRAARAGPPSCSRSSACAIRRPGWTTTRTSSPAACGNAS